MDDSHEFLVGEAARLYNIKPNTLSVACEKGEIPAYKTPGSKFWRIPNSSKFQSWVQAYQYRRRSGKDELNSQLPAPGLQQLIEQLETRAAQELTGEPLAKFKGYTTELKNLVK
jgi:hypothetical protein